MLVCLCKCVCVCACCVCRLVRRRVLERLDSETEDAQGQMQRAIKQVNELIDKAGEGWSWGMIGCLVVCLVVLIVVVFKM